MCGAPGAAEVAEWFVHNDGMRESRTHECGKFWIAEFDMCGPAKTPNNMKNNKKLESHRIFGNCNYIQYVHPIGSWRSGRLTDTWFISTNNWFCCGCCWVVAVRESIRKLIRFQNSEWSFQKKEITYVVVVVARDFVGTNSELVPMSVVAVGVHDIYNS